MHKGTVCGRCGIRGKVASGVQIDTRYVVHRVDVLGIAQVRLQLRSCVTRQWSGSPVLVVAINDEEHQEGAGEVHEMTCGIDKLARESGTETKHDEHEERAHECPPQDFSRRAQPFQFHQADQRTDGKKPLDDGNAQVHGSLWHAPHPRLAELINEPLWRATVHPLPKGGEPKGYQDQERDGQAHKAHQVCSVSHRQVPFMTADESTEQ